MASPPRRLLSIQQAADHLGRNEYFLRRAVRDRLLTYYRVGNLLRFDTADLDRFLDTCRVEGRQS